VIIEVKVAGNANWTEEATKTLSLRLGPKASDARVFGYTFRLRAFLQVMMTKLLFQKTFPETVIGRVAVMRMVRTGPGQIGIAVLEPPNWLELVAKYDMVPRMLGTLTSPREPAEGPDGVL
jgi:hypothetical protein